MVTGKKIKRQAAKIEHRANSFEEAKSWLKTQYLGSKKDLNLLAKLVLRKSKNVSHRPS